MSFAEGLYQALTGKSPRSAERASTQQKTQDLMKRYGSTRRVAEEVGVSQRTVQKWLKGVQEAKNTRRSANADKLHRAHRAARITPGRAAQFKGAAAAPEAGATGIGGLSLFGTIRVSQDRRDRWINPGAKIPAGELDHVVDTMAAQGPEAAAGQLNDLIDRYYVQGMVVETIEAIEY
jgi:hypothetical protein